MSDSYKFEMLRFDEAAQITMSNSVRAHTAVCTEVTFSFAKFLRACGFTQESIVDAFQQVENELSAL